MSLCLSSHEKFRRAKREMFYGVDLSQGAAFAEEPRFVCVDHNVVEI